MRNVTIMKAALAGFILLAGTATQPALAQQKQVTPAMAAQQLARGAKAWASNCSRCHGLRDPKELSDTDWAVSVAHMRVRANLPGDIARDIAAFLKSSN